MFLTMIWAMYQLRVRILERRQSEIRALNEQLMKAQEEERMRIAGELHDGVLQQLTSLTIRLSTATLKLASDSEPKAKLRELQKDLIQMGTDIRHLSHELHPALLQEAGLPAALSSYCEEFSNVRGIPVSYEADESVDELSPWAALCIYRIAQEALGNVAKHSRANQVEVRLSPSDGNVCLSVSDDGVGFSPSDKSGGLGLINMRERVHQLNGTFEFESEPGRGTTVRVAIPFRLAS
jgi:two-component system sensor histidine kinase UhpB